MNQTILVEAGLTDAQAAAYTFLAQNSPIAPPALAVAIEESRTNTYKVLEQLEELGLAQKDESDKKIKYWAKNPSALLQLVKDRQQEAELQAKKLESSLPTLVHDFMKHNEQPGVKFYQGKEGIKQVYDDTLECGQDVMFIRSAGDKELMTVDYYRELSKKRFKRGMKVSSITTNPTASLWSKEQNEAYGISRFVIDKDRYSAPVEIIQYADKVALLSFENEAIGMIIESPQIALAIKQLLLLAKPA